MSNDLTLFENAQVPAHIKAMFGAADNSDLSAGVSTGFPIISIKGKVWHVVQGGVRTLVADEHGEPRSSIEVVILKSNPNVSKLYYSGGYTEGSDERPTCFSHDGIVPSEESAEKQALKCAVCPRNQWGSRVTENGAKGKECSDSRRLAVAPYGDLSNPMLLRVPAASLKELVIYADMLAKRATPYQAVVTKIGFDHTVAHQKFTFKPIRWLTAEEVAQVAETMKGMVVEQIVGSDTTHERRGGPSPLDEMEGERPANIAAVAQKVTVSDVEAAIEPKAAPVTPKPAADKPKSSTAGFGSPSAAQKAAATAALAAEVAAIIEKPVEETPAPAAEVVKPARDHSALLQAATASLDDVLAQFDD